MASPKFSVPQVPRVSSIVRSPYLKTIFERAERDFPPTLVEPERPDPVLTGGAVVRELAEA